MTTNWENFLKNLGEWRGSFTHVSPQGELLDSTPSILNLEGFDDNQAVRFRLRRFGEGGYDTPPIQDYQQEYRSLARQIIFFDTGAFSKGPQIFAPFTQFGAEYGFVQDNRRLRLVQLYDKDGSFASLTLIREFRSGTDAQERPPLTIDQLIGTWEGEAYTAYPDWQPPTVYSTRLEVRSINDGHIEQRLSFADQQIVSTARVEGNQIYFGDRDQPISRQITLLPDGASSNVPLKLQRRQPFLVEAGWLVTEDERQRLIRCYDEKGEWESSTHVIERRVSS
jgi:hypothetical protein